MLIAIPATAARTAGIAAIAAILPVFGEPLPGVVVTVVEVVGAVAFAAMFIAFTIIVMQRRKLVK